jgi:hypothetical protein
MARSVGNRSSDDAGSAPAAGRTSRKRTADEARDDSDEDVAIVDMSDLPDIALDVNQKTWLGELHTAYCADKARKGTRNGKNGKKYVTKILPDFVSRFHPSLNDEQAGRYAKKIHDVSSVIFYRCVSVLRVENTMLRYITEDLQLVQQLQNEG